MRKKIRHGEAAKSPQSRALQLSRETVRTLTPQELSQVVRGGDQTCPTGSGSSSETKTQQTSNI